MNRCLKKVTNFSWPERYISKKQNIIPGIPDKIAVQIVINRNDARIRIATVSNYTTEDSEETTATGY